MIVSECAPGRPKAAPVCVLLLVAGLLVASTGLGAESLRRTAVVEAIERAKPAVVSIRGTKLVVSDASYSSEAPRKVNGMGTGVIIDPAGYIVTNYHVVEGVGRIHVTLADGRTTIAQLVAHDRKTDLAVLKIETSDPLATIPIGTSRDLMHGEDVIAIGNAVDYPMTATRGIISALHRRVEVSDVQYYDDLIQTDASINPGNSGGPLLNINGEMIGINAAVRMEAQGIGFAIPVDTVVEVTARLISPNRLRGIDHGITVEEEVGRGLRAASVRPSSPADRAGIQPGDYIQRVDGLLVSRQLDLNRAFLDKSPGDAVSVSLLRGGDTIDVVLHLNGAGRASSSASPSWELLGLELEPLPRSQFASYKPPTSAEGREFQGGLLVVAVRPQSPAAQQRIRVGDVLVGLNDGEYDRETMTLEHLAWILQRLQAHRPQPVWFYILRDRQVYYGGLNVAWAPSAGSMPR